MRFGFSLIEILVVLSIMVVVAGLAMPASMSMVRSWRLTMAGHAMVDKLNLARQSALTRNHTVEVRFYQYGDQAEGENARQPQTGRYRAFQLLEINDAGRYVPIGKVEHLPTSVIIDHSTQLTSLFSLSSGEKAGSPSYGSIPAVGINYNFIAFQYLADGSTNLTPRNSLWFLSLHDIHNGDSLTALPPNYCTIQIDPFNGHVTSYRP